jgi:Arylsulfotransferase (ASST)
MRPHQPTARRRAARRLPLVCLAATCVLAPAAAAGAAVRVNAAPRLKPGFRTSVPDYVTRCKQGAPVHFAVSARHGSAVAIGGGQPRKGDFAVDAPLDTDTSVTVRVVSDGRSRTHHVRCLPRDFPTWTVHRHAKPQSQWYVVTPVGRNSFGYVTILDARGVPVWWAHSSWYAPWDGKLTSDGNLIWGRIFGTDFGLDPRGGWEEHRLDGRTVRVLQTKGTPTDFHDLEQTPDGHYLLDSYQRRTGTVDLRRYGGPAHAHVYDAVIQELTPSGKLVWSWSSRHHIRLAENTWWSDIVEAQGRRDPSERRYDLVHINSMQPDGDGIIVSARFLDAVFRIDRKTGRVTWKLGGTPRPRSIAVKGDPYPFGGQHDARLLDDHTLTVYDNGASGRGQAARRPPRAERYRLDPESHTAELVEAVDDPAVPNSPWGGGARKLPSGNWVVNWGGTSLVSELTPTSRPVIDIQFQDGLWGYRAFPIPRGRVSARALRKGMDAAVRSGRIEAGGPPR